MENLRESLESDLFELLEGEWGMRVVLISPDGIVQDKRSGTDKPLVGQVIYDTIHTNPTTGEVLVVGDPAVSLRITSLDRVPKSGEKWFVKVPESPAKGAPLVDYVLTDTRAPEDGKSVGYIRLYPQKVMQS